MKNSNYISWLDSLFINWYYLGNSGWILLFEWYLFFGFNYSLLCRVHWEEPVFDGCPYKVRGKTNVKSKIMVYSRGAFYLQEVLLHYSFINKMEATGILKRIPVVVFKD